MEVRSKKRKRIFRKKLFIREIKLRANKPRQVRRNGRDFAGARVCGGP